MEAAMVTATALPVLQAPSLPRQRWLARLCFVMATPATVLVLVAAELRGSVGLLPVGVVGMPVALAGAWWFLTHRGMAGWPAGVVVILAPLTAAVWARAQMVWVVVVLAVLWLVTLAAGRRALAGSEAPEGPAEYQVPPPQRPYLIMNPPFGGREGRAVPPGRAARRFGAEVCPLNGPGVDVDVTVTDPPSLQFIHRSLRRIRFLVVADPEGPGSHIRGTLRPWRVTTPLQRRRAAKPLIFIQDVLRDRAFDAVMRRATGVPAR
jgi:hypothetical protein